MNKTLKLSDDVTLIQGDCLDVLPVECDAVVTDPPYGMNLDTNNSRFSGGHVSSQAKRGNGIGTGRGKPILNDDKPFDPSPWLDFPVVVMWGMNHFAASVPVGTTLVWIKRLDPAFGSFLSDAELAWMKGGCGVYCHRDLSMMGKTRKRQHPCQKPVGLISWCMDKANVKQGTTVLDPYMGSGTTGVACIRTGRKFVGIEKDARYFEIARERIAYELSQGKLAL